MVVSRYPELRDIWPNLATFADGEDIFPSLPISGGIMTPQTPYPDRLDDREAIDRENQIAQLSDVAALLRQVHTQTAPDYSAAMDEAEEEADDE